MLVSIGAIAIFVGLFAVATVRHVVGGFPISILVLLAGITLGIAQVKGTVDAVVSRGLARAAVRPVALPFVFFAITAAVAAMGSPPAGLVVAPLAMPIARRSGVDAGVMAIAINTGISTGGFAPTSLFGIVTYQIARRAGIDFNPLTLLTVATVSNLVLLVAALAIFRSYRPQRRSRHETELPWDAVASGSPNGAPEHPLEWYQIATMLCMVGLAVSVIACALAGIEPDIGAWMAFIASAWPNTNAILQRRRHPRANTT